MDKEFIKSVKELGLDEAYYMRLIKVALGDEGLDGIPVLILDGERYAQINLSQFAKTFTAKHRDTIAKQMRGLVDLKLLERREIVGVKIQAFRPVGGLNGQPSSDEPKTKNPAANQ